VPYAYSLPDHSSARTVGLYSSWSLLTRCFHYLGNYDATNTQTLAHALKVILVARRWMNIDN
jgi:hypothetical protein